MSATSSRRFAVLVPVKPPAFAKSRLGDLGDDARRDLATAFAVDTVLAAVACDGVARVLVVTDDHELASGLADLGVEVIPDGTSGDLNGTLRLAAAEMHRRDPDLWLVALCADLPALRPEELGRALDASAVAGMSFVADADGMGTTAVVAAGPDTFARVSGPPRGSGTSTQVRTRSDLVDVPSLRRDVDDKRRPRGSDGARPRPPHLAGRDDARAPGTLGCSHAGDGLRVRRGHARGRVLLDDGLELTFTAEALDGSRLRLLRPGQRVRLDTNGEGADLRIEHLQILTLS